MKITPNDIQEACASNECISLGQTEVDTSLQIDPTFEEEELSSKEEDDIFEEYDIFGEENPTLGEEEDDFEEDDFEEEEDEQEIEFEDAFQIDPTFEDDFEEEEDEQEIEFEDAFQIDPTSEEDEQETEFEDPFQIDPHIPSEEDFSFSSEVQNDAEENNYAETEQAYNCAECLDAEFIASLEMKAEQAKAINALASAIQHTPEEEIHNLIKIISAYVDKI